MSILSDRQIVKLVKDHKMIDPFVPRQIRSRKADNFGRAVQLPCISFGLSSYGYDIQLAPEFRVFQPRVDKPCLVDPKKMDLHLLKDYRGPDCLIPPNGFVLGCSIERFNMPSNVTGVVLGKSTYARCGIIVNCTPLEAGWRGILTIEISNTSSLPALIYAHEGIAQVLFFQGDECMTSYADRAGKYQDQKGIDTARL